jgi:N-acetylmuramoyl-L-alanine amidase
MRFFSFFILSLALAAALLPLGAPRATSAAPGKNAASLESLLAEFADLKQDDARSRRRDLWLALEEKFTRLSRAGNGENAAKAAFYAALAREELGRRSFLSSDRHEAVSLYEEVAKKHGASPFAPTALYRQAELLRNFLEDPAGADARLDRLRTRYPGSPEAAGAAKARSPAQKENARPRTGEDADAKTRRPPQGAAASKTTAAEDAKRSSVTIRNIVWTAKGERLLITLEMDGSAPYDYEFIPPDAARKTPARIYLDIAGAFPSQGLAPGMTPPSLMVTRIRTSQSGRGTRIMFDCDGVRCFAVRTPRKSPQTIQIELSGRMDIKDGTDVERRATPDAGSGQDKTRTGGGKGVPRENSLMEQLGLTVRTIMIDAGHGGKDPGAMTGGFVERDFTLAMARRLGALLQARGFSVLYTRTGNKYLPLQDRPDAANRRKADLFISVHLNANANPEIRGLEVYYLDMAKTQNAALVAARENAVSVKNISDLQVILTDLVLSSKLEESRELARLVHDGMLARVRRAGSGAQDNGVRSAPFYVLMGARMPAILIECGYASNAEDARNLRSEKFLQSQAEGVLDGILAYKAKLAKMTSR